MEAKAAQEAEEAEEKPVVPAPTKVSPLAGGGKQRKKPIVGGSTEDRPPGMPH